MLLVLFSVLGLALGCGDNNAYCSDWYRIGECSRNPDYMRVYCKQSCGLCGGGVSSGGCVNTYDASYSGYCSSHSADCHSGYNRNWMRQYCQYTCGTCTVAVNGGWGGYGAWSGCSETCGGGTRSRSRACDNPAPRDGGRGCEGARTQTEQCNTQQCQVPVDGQYSGWGPYSECSEDCGDGTQSRDRTCTNPAPSYGGQECQGPAEESKACNVQTCPVHGGWTPWTGFGPCSASCGTGRRTQTRTCTDPAPAHGGDGCTGPESQHKECRKPPCLPEEEEVGEWTPWGACSRPCGGGEQARSRACPSEDCSVELRETAPCNAHHCPIDGRVHKWNVWSACSAECGGGVRRRERYCTNPAPNYGGKDCVEHLEEEAPCNEDPCRKLETPDSMMGY